MTVLLCCLVWAVDPVPLFRSDFTRADWLSMWTIRNGGEWGIEQNCSLIDDSKFGKVLRVRYPKGSVDPSMAKAGTAPLGGAQWYGRLPTPVDKVRLSYRLRFDPNFDFAKGGKLPGLYGGTRVSGGRIPDGTDGFSTRFMWRKGGDGEVYAYLPTSESFGTSLGRGKWKFVPGQWHELVQKVRLNTPGSDDGSIVVHLDGREVLAVDGLRFRTVPTLKIEGIFFSTFFGGADASWAPSRDVSIDYAAFELTSIP